MDAPKIGAIVLNWNLPADTLACVRSLQSSSVRPDPILIVDNGSTDDSLAVFARELPSVRVLALARNVGFAAGMNAGLDALLPAGLDFVLLLNNDMVVDAAMLANLLDATTQPEPYAILSPLVYLAGDPQRVWHAGVRFGGILGLPRALPAHAYAQGGTVDVDAVPAAAWLVPAAVFARCGRFDTGDFMYYEDWRFCRRVKAGGGRVGVVVRAKAWHAVSASTKLLPALKHYHFARARVRYYVGAGPLWKRGALLAAILLNECLVWARLVVHRDRAGLVARMRGVVDGLSSVAQSGRRPA